MGVKTKKKSDVQVAGMTAFFILMRGHPFSYSIYEQFYTNLLNGNPVILPSTMK
jgi:hypothetical protein